ncbi:ubiquinol oxidase subunit II [Candidatus Zinderia endosymbiont of Aphrophora alni]|uniref:ubiquinol oxidase subunit II n=1 Tax=Candidatus Zinderia endosymbiont of Aphrophora alni TaxID=3077951 RepID=UPI0030D34A2F
MLNTNFINKKKFLVLNPNGDIAIQQSKLFLISISLLSIIMIPVIILSLFFAWKYRYNSNSEYKPNWNKSIKLELIIWGVPLIMILILGTLSWKNTHKLDPYKKLSRIDKNHFISNHIKYLKINVIALDWKWLFIYPKQKIASVNKLVIPINKPIEFKITSLSNMNSFFIPTLAGQIYAMPNMQTKLHAVINKISNSEGFSSNYSGEGFSDMRFKFKGVNKEKFKNWINNIKKNNKNSNLNLNSYKKLIKKSIKEPIHYYSKIDKNIFPLTLKGKINNINNIKTFKKK